MQCIYNFMYNQKMEQCKNVNHSASTTEIRDKLQKMRTIVIFKESKEMYKLT